MLNGLLNGLGKALDIGNGILSVIAMRNLVHLQRDEAVNRLATMMHSMTEAQLDELDANLLGNTLLFVDVEKRQRATEIYAVFKVLETARFGRFRGFSTGDQALS